MPSIRPTALNALLAVAAMVVIIAGLRAASTIVVPFLLAIFIVIVIAPLYFWLQKKGAPSWAALIALILGMIGMGTFAAGFFANAVNEFAANLPQYQSQLTGEIENSIDWLNSKGFEIEKQEVTEALGTKELFRQTASLLGSVSVILSNAFVIILVAIFILMEAARLPDKLRSLPGMTDQRWRDVVRIVAAVRRYMGMKTVMSALTGLIVTLWLWALDVDYPILLGFLAFVLNFVPSIGSFIASLPGIMLALLLHGVGDALICSVGYVAINVGVSNFIEPRYMGNGLGLSPMIVIVTLFVWGWMLGPIGMLLSVPLTMAIKVALEASEKTRGVAYLLSDTVPSPEEIERRTGASPASKPARLP